MVTFLYYQLIQLVDRIRANASWEFGKALLQAVGCDVSRCVFRLWLAVNHSTVMSCPSQEAVRAEFTAEPLYGTNVTETVFRLPA